MANSRVIKTFLSYTPSATSEDPNFPASNLKLYGHPFRPWKALVATGIVDVTFDFGLGNTLSGLAADPGIFLYPTNLTSLRIQGNSVLSWSIPPWDQAVTIAKERFTQRYKGFFKLAELNAATFAYRYLNVRIPSQTSTDAAVYRIGTVVVGQVVELVVNPSVPIARRRIDPASRLEFLDGGIEVIESGEALLEATFPRQLYSSAALTDQLDLDALGRGSSFVLHDAALGNSEHAWLFRRDTDAEYAQRFLNMHDGQFVVREVV